MISKTRYARFLQCPRLFWLSFNDSGKIAPADLHQKQLFSSGSEVGLVARQLFPGGVEVPVDPGDIPAMVRRTEELINSGTETIYEAAFSVDGLYAAVDILNFSGGKWHIHEVKSSTGIKPSYWDDGAFQAYVLRKSGLDVGSVNIIHINNQYVREGELDLPSLFLSIDVTKLVKQREKAIPDHIGEMEKILEGDEPSVSIGPFCLSPNRCGAFEYCWKEMAGVPEYSVFDLTSAHWEDKFELYNSGIVRIEDIPHIDRTPRQLLQIAGEEHIEIEPIREYIGTFQSPVTHLDFESYQQAIPRFDGIKAYQQVPFQYSIHIEREGGLEHREFLAPVGVDPRRLLAEKLIEDIPPEGTVLAYNRVFESGIIASLVRAFPDLSDSLLSISSRIEDLMVPFQKGWYYHPRMKGSFSIKSVLPAMVPEMEAAYGELPVVHNGGEVSALWGALAGYDDPEEVERIRAGFLQYCRLDTLAMVRILEQLREL